MADPVPFLWALRGPPREEIESLTDVLAAGHGAEQRRGLRPVPRLFMRFDGIAEGDDRRRMEQALAAVGVAEWMVPMEFDSGPLLASAAAGATTIEVDTRWRHYAAGRHALITRAHTRRAEVVMVDAVTDGEIGLAEPTTLAWQEGDRISPAIACEFAEQPTLARFTGDAIAYSIRFRAIRDVAWAPAGAAMPTYRGLPVLELLEDWGARDPTSQGTRLVYGSDDGVARPGVYDLAGVPLPTIARAYAADTFERLAALRTVLYALDGRRCPAWLPSLSLDLVVASDVAGGATEVNLGWTGLAATGPIEGRRDIRIALAGGTVLYRRITAATEISDAIEQVTVDSALPAFTAEQVQSVSWLHPVRQNSDVAVLEWLGYGAASTSLTFKGLRDGL